MNKSETIASNLNSTIFIFDPQLSSVKKNILKKKIKPVNKNLNK